MADQKLKSQQLINDVFFYDIQWQQVVIATINMLFQDLIEYTASNPQKTLLGAVIVVGLLHYLSYVTYNLFFHPLRKIPGPRLAAATYIPEFYYDVLRSGLYTKQIQQMHLKYGMSRSSTSTHLDLIADL